MRMKDKVVIVTGAARGLGRAFAERLAAEGAGVVCGDVRPCDDTVATIRGDRKSTRLNSSHIQKSRMPSSA